MNDDWYTVKGVTQFEDKDINIVSLELMVRASSVEEACKKARDFIKPIAEFEPTDCNWDN